MLLGKKKNYIRADGEIPGIVIGIASNERIWKICWEINRVLGVELATQESELGSLRRAEVYLDNETDEDFEYLLFEAPQNQRGLPKVAKNFRFWLAVSPQRDKRPEVETLLENLKTIQIISFAHDLSAEKDINKFLP